MADESETIEPLDESNKDELPPETEGTKNLSPSENETQRTSETRPSENVTPETETPVVSLPPQHTEETSESTANNENDLLKEQFENYMRIAKALLTTLRRPKDVDICNNLLRKVQQLNNSPHLEVKRNNNRFFRYCLRVIKFTSENQPLHWYQNRYKRSDEESVMERSTEKWLVENNFYMAAKSYKDGTSIVYTAVAKDPEAGWQAGGLKDFEQLNVCENYRNRS